MIRPLLSALETTAPGRWLARQRARRAALERETAGWLPTRERITWLVVCLSLVVAPHLVRLPPWIPLLFIAVCLWRLAVPIFGVSMPPRWGIAVLGISALPLVAWSYGTLLGRNAGVATLVVLSGVKLLETRTLRDAATLSFLGFFLVVTNFLYSQSIGTGVYMLLVVVAMTAALTVTGSHSPRLRTRTRLRLAGAMLAQAAPLALLLFVLFPRIPGPLWGLPRDAFDGVSGLSNEMSPGSLSSLGLSDAVAFRVQFDGPPPDVKQMYWRGPVLTQTDGISWVAVRDRRRLGPQLRYGGDPVTYSVTLEATQRNWRFGLDAVREHPDDMRLSMDMRLLARERLTSLTRYRVTSYLDYRLGTATRNELAHALTLPTRAHPEVRELVAGWAAQDDDPRNLVERALTLFRTEKFHYTLQPPLLDGDRIDGFVFDTRRGFCEHYAAAFVVMMRAGGVPARVVTGYQGGEFNELGDYLLVRQRDAHAWAEVWLEDSGWVRVDPTGAVAPERIERGIEAAIPSTRGPAALVNMGAAAAEPLVDAWRRLRLATDAVNHRWNQWVLGYGPQRQRELLSRFGLDTDDLVTLAAITSAAVMLALLLVGLWLLRPVSQRLDPVGRAWRRFTRLAARHGCTRLAHEGPRDFAQRAGVALPGWAPAIERIAKLYEVLRYAPPGAADEDMLAALEREVSQLGRADGPRATAILAP